MKLDSRYASIPSGKFSRACSLNNYRAASSYASAGAISSSKLPSLRPVPAFCIWARHFRADEESDDEADDPRHSLTLLAYGGVLREQRE